MAKVKMLTIIIRETPFAGADAATDPSAIFAGTRSVAEGYIFVPSAGVKAGRFRADKLPSALGYYAAQGFNPPGYPYYRWHDAPTLAGDMANEPQRYSGTLIARAINGEVQHD